MVARTTKPLRATRTECDHLNVRNKLIEGKELFVCRDCSMIVDPNLLPGNTVKPVKPDGVSVIPIRFVLAKYIDDGPLHLVQSIEIKEDMLIDFPEVGKVVCIPDVQVGDKVKLYRAPEKKG